MQTDHIRYGCGRQAVGYHQVHRTGQDARIATLRALADDIACGNRCAAAQQHRADRESGRTDGGLRCRLGQPHHIGNRRGLARRSDQDDPTQAAIRRLKVEVAGQGPVDRVAAVVVHEVDAADEMLPVVGLIAVAKDGQRDIRDDHLRILHRGREDRCGPIARIKEIDASKRHSGDVDRAVDVVEGIDDGVACEIRRTRKGGATGIGGGPELQVVTVAEIASHAGRIGAVGDAPGSSIGIGFDDVGCGAFPDEGIVHDRTVEGLIDRHRHAAVIALPLEAGIATVDRHLVIIVCGGRDA